MTAHDELEGRYRRLMAAYPLRHRREYEEEMVGVLLAGAEPEQRRPSARDRADILVNALAVRVRGWAGDLGDPAWRRAASAVQVVGALFLLIVGIRWVLPGLTFYPGVDALEIARPAVWAVVFALALAGLRRLAAGIALAGALVEIAHVAQWYGYSPSQVLRSSWLVTVALLVAVCSAWLAVGVRVAAPRGLWWFGAALALAGCASVADQYQGMFHGFSYAVTMNDQFLFRYAAPLYLAAAALAGWAWWRQGSLVRRRILALTAPVAAIATMVTYGFAGFMYSSQQFPSPILLRPFQWAILLATPVVAFAVAVVALNRWERLSALVELGRRAETPEPRV
ncbi:hypothetical protein ACIBSW_31740 [Actinoplanes sp. NPDC049668]|uniref:hypothetical protein n=1 Tax=unclassified Actinoplanes TaxID=2626549 RepID=UPI00339FFF41